MFDGVVVDPAESVEASPLGHGPHPPPLRGARIKHQNILRGRPARAAEPPTYKWLYWLKTVIRYGGVTCHDDLVVEGDAPEAESVRGQGAGGEPGGRPRHQQLRGVEHLVEPAQGLTARHQEDLHTAVIWTLGYHGQGLASSLSVLT